MLKKLLEYEKRCVIEIEEYLTPIRYRHERYGESCSVAMLYSENPIDLDTIENSLRMSDSVMKFTENFGVIVFDDTCIDGGIKALEKLLVKINPNGTANIYSAVIECDPQNDGSALVRKLFNLIDFAIAKGHPNEALDASYLDSIY
jgi:uncharacterized protein with ATP-grasp and redox domains